MQILTLLLLLVVKSGWATQLCDKDKGPSGTIECLLFSRYHNQYQWGTCLSQAHVQVKSGHDHICKDRSRNYCWYQCMLEMYGNSSGFVKDDCSCDPYGNSPSTSLPEMCDSPSGDNCYWYRICLEKKYPCKPSDNGYVIRYAERFCRAFEEQKAKLSLDAQKWMEAVRKCLQVAAVPLLSPSANPTCSEIRAKTLASHTSCYLNLDYGVPSICDLNCWQHFKIFWTIRGSFTKLDTAWESLKGLWNIGSQCTPSKIEENDKCFQRNLKSITKFLKLNTENLLKRKRRSSDPFSKGDVLSRFADGVGSAIASALKWNTDVMDWIAYTANWVSIGNLDIVIAMVDKKALGIVTAPIPSVDFPQTVQDFASAVRKGTLRLQVDGYNVWVKSLSACYDKSCDTTQTLATSSKPPWNGSTKISLGTVGLCGATVIAVWIILKDRIFF